MDSGGRMIVKTKKMDHIVVFAPSIHTGGGLVLLRALLGAEWPARRRTAYLDARSRSELANLTSSFDLHWVARGLASRLRAEWLLARSSRAGDTVLCFHNLPPLFRTRGRILCYLQNVYLVKMIPSAHLNGATRYRLLIQRFLARVLRRRIDRYLVQTPTMQAALAKWYGPDEPTINVLPIAPTNLKSAAESPGGRRENESKRRDFIYVSDGLPHKNHRRLFAAWRLLADWGVRPSLALTLHPERDAALRDEVRALAAGGLLIEDLGTIPHPALLTAYRQLGALIFPSYAESFGNPLVEASALGLPILAPELDYVRDVCEPAATFDPFSPRSIARAVLRFMGAMPDLIRPMAGDDFAKTLCLLEAEEAQIMTGHSEFHEATRRARPGQPML